MRSPRAVLCLVLLARVALGAEPETGLFCPLSVEPNPALTEPLEALQKRFLSVARERSGYELLLRKEVEDAVKTAGVTHFAQSDTALAKLATEGKVLNAGYVSLKLTERNELLLEGRVVRADGKRVKATTLVVPRATGPLLDVFAVAAERFFDQLNSPAPPIAVALSAPPEAVVVSQPVAAAAPGSPLRLVGLVLGGVGVATGGTGVLVFATAGTVLKDASGNIASFDAARVPRIRTQQGVGIALITAGAAVGIAGLVTALLAPSAPVTAVVAPRADGALFVVAGRFR